MTMSLTMSKQILVDGSPSPFCRSLGRVSQQDRHFFFAWAQLRVFAITGARALSKVLSHFPPLIERSSLQLYFSDVTRHCPFPLPIVPAAMVLCWSAVSRPPPDESSGPYGACPVWTRSQSAPPGGSLISHGGCGHPGPWYY